MNKQPNDQALSSNKDKAAATLAEQVEGKAKRKLKARQHASQRVWFGLGMMGMIGWSVAIPTLLGAISGVYLDRHLVSERSWTLALMVAGLTLGCFNAWHWIAKEDQAIKDEQNGAEKKTETPNDLSNK